MSEIKNLPHSIHERLKNQARLSGKPFAWYLRFYAMERFLFRLSKSKFCNSFILKGGLMFMGWQIPLRRFTRDIDFRGFTSNDQENIKHIIQNICVQEVEPDGIEYDAASVSTETITEEAEYSGVRVKFDCCLGEKTTIPMQIDIGFSDEITPEPLPVIFPTLLQMPSPMLKGYPKETVVSEKLHCIVYRGDINSRFKDFYDLWLISRHFNFDGKILQQAIQKTFSNRETGIPSENPPGLNDYFANEKQNGWTNFLKGFSPDISELDDFKAVIIDLRKFILPVLHELHQEAIFDCLWNPIEGKWSPKVESPD